ncbi:hypothetical protein AB8B22_04460 [Leptotrichia sp. HSP-334]|uniref:Lipoprotein n=1 Tax=Leptotrichia rugosa TaxID=3239302 RepID=A0AB39VIV3_9FUSO
MKKTLLLISLITVLSSCGGGGGGSSQTSQATPIPNPSIVGKSISNPKYWWKK